MFLVTEWHSGRKQTAKVIIICGHAASHLTDGDNISKHFSIKKKSKQTNRRGEETQVCTHKRSTSRGGKKREKKQGNDLEELIPH